MDYLLIATIAAIISLLLLILSNIAWIIWTRGVKRKAQELATRADRAEALHTTQQNAEQRMREAFNSISREALQQNNEQFLQLAQEKLERQQETATSDLTLRKQEIGALVEPLKETLKEQQEHLRELERARSDAYGRIDENLRLMKDGQTQLQTETAKLVQALRQPHIRGRWGELQLRQVVELAGMSPYCDFCEQKTSSNGEDSVQRPDLQVRLPNNRQIVVDSKVPLSAYIEAFEATDDTVRQERLKAHARHVREHVNTMSKRGYHAHIPGAHDFTVLFVPGEVFYSAALEQDGDLLEYAFKKGIILANPTTLIALLKAVAYGWNEAHVAENARKIGEAGKDLYERINILARHVAEMGEQLDKSVKAYNKAVGSLESRLLPTARNLHSLQAQNSPMTEQAELTEVPRTVRPELMGEADI